MKLLPEISELSKEKFFKKVKVVQSGCWEWQGRLNQSGYGETGRHSRAHRVSFAIHFHDPGEFHVCHKCDNRKCVNPDHLFLGNDLDNMRDMILKGRARPNRPGLLSPLKKIDPQKLEDMCLMYISDKKMTTRGLAKFFDLSGPRCYYWLKYAGIKLHKEKRK